MQDWLAAHLVYEHQDFLVFNKPANVSFHCENDEKYPENNATGFFEMAKQAYQERNGSIPLFPVHRLDKMTSGLLIVAKNKQAASQFGRMFAAHDVNKFYIALAMGKPKKKQGTVKGDMQRSRRSSWMLTKSLSNPAITCFKSVALPELDDGMRLYLLQPKTGKTHQLRVMMKSIGAAILGDPIYATQVQRNQQDRGYLHAFALHFQWGSECISLTCLPTVGKHFLENACIDALENWRAPWLLAWPKSKK